MTYDPLRLIQFALEEGIPIQIIDFGKAVTGVQIPEQVLSLCDGQAPREGELPHHISSGEENLVGALCTCGKSHSAKERCAACGRMIPWHDFPGRTRVAAILRVEAPVAVGKDLQQPADQRDCYILIHVPRQALVRMESPLVTRAPLIVRPS